MLHWQLFIDHAGAFAAPGGPAVVAGVLLQGSPSYFHDCFDAALGKSYPAVRRPTRASYLANPISRIVEAMLLGDARGQAEREAADACLGPRAALRAGAAAEPLLAELEACIARRDTPPPRVLDACDAWLRRHHYLLWAELADLRERQDSAFRDYCRRLRREYIGEGRGFVVAAFDNESSGPAADRYWGALEALLERAIMLLGSAVGPVHAISVHTTVFEGEAGGPRAALRPRIEGLFRSATGYPLMRDPIGNLRVGAVPPARFEAGIHPGLEVAGIVAHRVLVATRRHYTWREVRAAAERLLELPVDAVSAYDPGAGRLSAVAAQGLAREAIRAAYEERRSPPADLKLLHPRWKEDQAQLWIGAARRVC